MDSWPSTREVEKPKPAKLRAAEMATELEKCLPTGGPNLVLLHTSTLRETVNLLRELAGAGRG